MERLLEAPAMSAMPQRAAGGAASAAQRQRAGSESAPMPLPYATRQVRVCEKCAPASLLFAPAALPAGCFTP